LNLWTEKRLIEADLILRSQQGDPDAWEELVRTHQEPVFRLAYLFLGDPDDAEDAAQETFIRAYQSLARFDLSRPFRPWVMSIVANQARNRLRSLKRYLSAAQRFFQTDPQSMFSTSNGAETRLDSTALWQTVKRLSLTDQQMIYLRYFLDMSESETAQALGIPAGTVKSRLHRALNRLRGLISTDFLEENEEAVHGP